MKRPPLGSVLRPEFGDLDVLDAEVCVPDPQDNLTGPCLRESDGAVPGAVDGDSHVHAVNGQLPVQ